MKKVLFLIMLFGLTFSVMGQENVTNSEENSDNNVYSIVETMPEPEGGLNNIYSFLANNTKYPKTAIDKNISGLVIVEFVVEKDGSISNPVVKRSLSPECDAEAVRVVKSMPNWTPAKMGDKTVRCRYALPIRFLLK